MGLPLHPLAVHIAVVLLPLGALGLIAAAFSDRLRQRYGLVTTGIFSIGALSLLVAKESGEALAAQVGLPAQHEAYANALVIVGLIAMVVAIGWMVWERRAETRTVLHKIASVVVALLGVAVITLTALTGHSGAEAVWGDEASTADGTSQTENTSGGTDTYTADEVAQHSSTDDCWASVDGKVYDLTEWVSEHPGGPDAIGGLCGTDATEAFHGQHGDAPDPNEALAGFEIGTLE